MKANSKMILITAVFVVFANTFVQMLAPSGPIEYIMLAAAALVLFGVKKIVKALDDPEASGWSRRITIAWIVFEVVFGPTVLMILIGLGFAFLAYHGKAKTTDTEKSTDQAK